MKVSLYLVKADRRRRPPLLENRDAEPLDRFIFTLNEGFRLTRASWRIRSGV